MNRTRAHELLTRSKPDLFGRAIELVTDKDRRKDLRRHIERETVRV